MKGSKISLLPWLHGDGYADEVVRQASWVASNVPALSTADLPERVVDVHTPHEPDTRVGGRPYTDRFAECQAIADIAEPTDTVRALAAKLGLAKSSVGRRIRAMERDLGLDPLTAAEIAAARFHPTGRRAGAVAKRWRRHCL